MLCYPKSCITTVIVLLINLAVFDELSNVVFGFCPSKSVVIRCPSATYYRKQPIENLPNDLLKQKYNLSFLHDYKKDHVPQEDEMPVQMSEIDFFPSIPNLFEDMSADHEQTIVMEKSTHNDEKDLVPQEDEPIVQMSDNDLFPTIPNIFEDVSADNESTIVMETRSDLSSNLNSFVFPKVRTVWPPRLALL